MPSSTKEQSAIQNSPDTEPAHCPVRSTLALIGGKYKAFILWNLFDGTMRFSQLQKAVPQANAKMLSQQLKELERDGLISRKAYPVIPPKVEYSLTELGQSLKPVMICIYEWGSAYLKTRGIEPNCSMKPFGKDNADKNGGRPRCCG